MEHITPFANVNNATNTAPVHRSADTESGVEHRVATLRTATDQTPPSVGQAPTSRPNPNRSQVADNRRLPWDWKQQKTSDPYVPKISGKWWSSLSLAGPSRVHGHNAEHIARIMETELGEQLFGNDRCRACQQRNQECWRYSRRGAAQIRRAGSTCARCRVTARQGGCSLSKYQKNSGKVSHAARLRNPTTIRPLAPRPATSANPGTNDETGARHAQ